MKKNFSVILLFLLGGHLIAQQSKSLLWEVSGKGLKSSSYLFGTYHLITSSFVDSFPVVQEKLRETKSMAGELVMDSSLYPKITKAAMMPDSSLDQLLSKEDYKVVSDYLKEISGMSLALFNKMKPVMVNILIYTVLLPKSDAGTAMDIYFQEVAKKTGKKVYGLETVEDQIAVLFDGMPVKRQAELLVRSVKEKEKNYREMMQMNQCYRNLDLNCLSSGMKEEEGYSDAELKKMVDSRNQKWMKVIPGLMQSGGVFIAVGAGHLPGEQGLLKLLEKEGYTVRAVEMKRTHAKK
jgi:uncharacterized protein YbaP (TraB family)